MRGLTPHERAILALSVESQSHVHGTDDDWPVAFELVRRGLLRHVDHPDFAILLVTTPLGHAVMALDAAARGGAT